MLYHGVKVLPLDIGVHAARRAARRTVEEIISHLQPDILAIEESFYGRSKRLAAQVALTRALQSLGQKHEIMTECYPPTSIRKYLCGSGWAGKRDVALMVTYRYPELKPYIVHDRRWKERFHGHMFDAVAVGLFALSHR